MPVSFPPGMTVDIFLPKPDLVLPPEAIDHPDIVHSGLLHLLVHIPLYILRPLLPFYQLTPRYSGSINEITDRVIPCLLDNRGDREASHTFEHVVVHHGHVGGHNSVPRTICVIEQGPFLQLRSMRINPLCETYAAPGLPARGLLSLLCLRRGLPCMPRSSMFEICPDGLKLPPLVLQAQRLERLHKFLTAEPREEV